MQPQNGWFLKLQFVVLKSNVQYFLMTVYSHSNILQFISEKNAEHPHFYL